MYMRNTRFLILISGVEKYVKLSQVNHLISSTLPLAGGAYPMRGLDVVVVVVVCQLLFQIATPP